MEKKVSNHNKNKRADAKLKFQTWEKFRETRQFKNKYRQN